MDFRQSRADDTFYDVELSDFDRTFHQTSPQQEVEDLKRHYEEVLARSESERRNLEIQLIQERQRADQVIKTAELEINKLRNAYEATISSLRIDVEKHRQNAECSLKESQMLHEQLVEIQTERAELLKCNGEMRRQIDIDAREKRAAEAYLKAQQENMNVVRNKLKTLMDAKQLLETLTRANEQKIQKYDHGLISIDKACQAKDAKIKELEEQLTRKDDVYEQTTAMIAGFETSLNGSNQLVAELKNKNSELSSCLEMVGDSLQKNWSKDRLDLERFCEDLDAQSRECSLLLV